MFKKIISLFSILCLLLTFVACTNTATETESKAKETELSFSYNHYGQDDFITITGVNNFNGETLAIDSKYEGYYVKYIGEGAFSGMTKLVSVTLPDTVISIGDNAFKGCKALKEVNIPASVQYMGANVFENCSDLVIKLETKEAPGTWSENWAEGSKSISFGTKDVPAFDNDNTNSTNNNTTNNNTSNNSTNNNNNTQTSGYSTGLIFEYYSSGVNSGYMVKGVGTCKDEHIKIPPTYKGFNDREAVAVVGISDNAFKNATFIKHVTIPDSVYKIGKSAFAGCSNIESITTPLIGADHSSSEVLGYLFGSNAFEGAEKISQHTMMGYNSKLEMRDYYIPTSLRSITLTKSDYCYGMFSGCYFLTSVTLKQDAQYPNLGAYAFYGCKGLTEFKLSSKYESIGDYAFYGCENLKTVTFENDANYIMLEEIGDSAFEGCKALESFTIPSNVKKIWDGAFGNCESLKSITIPSTVTYMGYKVFDSGCKSLTSIRVLASSSNRNQWDDSWNDTNINPTYN